MENKNLKYVVYLLVIILLAVTNPPNSKHKEKIRDNISPELKTGWKILDNAISDVAGFTHDYTYNDYVVFSTTTFESNGGKHLLSIGLLGFVVSAQIR